MAGADLSFEEALNYIHGLERFGSRPGLERMKMLAEEMGNPQRGLKTVHIGGTNGKGSTCSLVAEVLASAGMRVGLYTKPHLQSYRERIRINGEPLPREKLAGFISWLSRMGDLLVGRGMDHPTQFEVEVAMMLAHFAAERVDACVVEVGMGGRLDATNVLEDPLVSAITNVGLDHLDVLGSDVRQIAWEKAGIIRDGGCVVTAAEGEGLAVIERVCREHHASLCRVGKEITWEKLQADSSGNRFNVRCGEARYEGLEVGLLGPHQVKNACTAVGVVEALRRAGMGIAEESLREGLGRARWPGRLEVMQQRPLVVLDGAHNRDGAAVLAAAVRHLFGGRRLVLVLGVLADKEVGAIVDALAPLAEFVVVTMPANRRAAATEIVAREVRKRAAGFVEEPRAREAVRLALSRAGPDDMVLVSGSLYLVGEVRGMWIDSQP